MESERSTKSDDADILRQVWYERVLMHFPHVQCLTLEIKRNALEKIRNAAFYYRRSWVVKRFIVHMIEMYCK